MSSNPVKTFAFVGMAAVIAAGMLSNNIDTSTGSSQSAGTQNSDAPARGSWWSSLFDGMEFRSEPPRVAAQPAPAAAEKQVIARSSGFGSVVLKADQRGHFNARIEIEGQQVPMLVDTGASVIALRHEDAMILGINPAPSDFTAPIATANGELKAARVQLREVRIENITVSNVQAVVLPAGALQQSLLGMSFMNKLSKFEIAEGELILKP